MKKILKKAQAFSEKKLRASLKRAHAVPKAAKASVVAVKDRLHKGLIKSTSDVRRTVGNVLKKLDPRALKSYMKFRKKR
ncbi:MAG: hypothetical protein AB1529_05980 [Candidatus Micrarchaeota archaeon]